MSHTPRLPWFLRTLNRLGSLSGGRRPTLDAAHLWGTAARAAAEDAPFPQAYEALEVLLSHAKAARLSTFGRLALTAQLPDVLEQLLRVRSGVPDESAPVLPPVFILALPRTGTTLLHRLLSLHEGARWPRMWELQRPYPAPRPGTDDPRKALSEAGIRRSNLMMPALMQMHALDANGPDECYFVLVHTACCAAFDAQLPVPGYTRWFLEQDLRWTYAHHRRSLLLLQRHMPGAFWLLKSPLHLFGLDALRATYPDARLVVTHRQPREVAGSCCSLYASTRAIYVDEVEEASLGKPWLETWGTATDRAARQLQDWPADRVVHVGYPDLLRDPVGVTERVAEKLGLPVDPGLAARVADWTAQPEHRKHSRGAHVYSLQQYGLREEEVDERFSAWCRVGERTLG